MHHSLVPSAVAPASIHTHLSPARYSSRAVKALTKGISLSARISGRTPRSTRLCVAWVRLGLGLAGG